jgi:hypothetical protein
MRTVALALATLLLCAAGSGQGRPAEVVVVETKAHREEGKIMIDGRVRAARQRPLRGLVVIFDLLTFEKNVIASERAVLDEDQVAAGQERAFHSWTSDHARAVRVSVRAVDRSERELRVGNPGPFSIE